MYNDLKGFGTEGIEPLPFGNEDDDNVAEIAGWTMVNTYIGTLRKREFIHLTDSFSSFQKTFLSKKPNFWPNLLNRFNGFWYKY